MIGTIALALSLVVFGLSVWLRREAREIVRLARTYRDQGEAVWDKAEARYQEAIERGQRAQDLLDQTRRLLYPETTP